MVFTRFSRENVHATFNLSRNDQNKVFNTTTMPHTEVDSDIEDLPPLIDVSALRMPDTAGPNQTAGSMTDFSRMHDSMEEEETTDNPPEEDEYEGMPVLRCGRRFFWQSGTTRKNK